MFQGLCQKDFACFFVQVSANSLCLVYKQHTNRCVAFICTPLAETYSMFCRKRSRTWPVCLCMPVHTIHALLFLLCHMAAPTHPGFSYQLSNLAKLHCQLFFQLFFSWKFPLNLVVHIQHPRVELFPPTDKGGPLPPLRNCWSSPPYHQRHISAK